MLMMLMLLMLLMLLMMLFYADHADDADEYEDADLQDAHPVALPSWFAHHLAPKKNRPQHRGFFAVFAFRDSSIPITYPCH